MQPGLRPPGPRREPPSAERPARLMPVQSRLGLAARPPWRPARLARPPRPSRPPRSGSPRGPPDRPRPRAADGRRARGKARTRTGGATTAASWSGRHAAPGPSGSSGRSRTSPASPPEEAHSVRAASVAVLHSFFAAVSTAAYSAVSTAACSAHAMTVASVSRPGTVSGSHAKVVGAVAVTSERRSWRSAGLRAPGRATNSPRAASALAKRSSSWVSRRNRSGAPSVAGPIGVGSTRYGVVAESCRPQMGHALYIAGGKQLGQTRCPHG